MTDWESMRRYGGIGLVKTGDDEVILSVADRYTEHIITSAFSCRGSGLLAYANLEPAYNEGANSGPVMAEASVFRITPKTEGGLDYVCNYFDRLYDTNISKQTETDLTYTNNIGRKSFQWELWPMCNNLCKFCYLGHTNRNTDKARQMKSLTDFHKAIDNFDWHLYNNISIIGGEFFQGQLDDPEVHDLFMDAVRKVARLYYERKIGSIWVTATLTIGDQHHLYEMLDLFRANGVAPRPDYGASGLWLCTSWDAEGRFHTPEHKANWEHYMLDIHEKYPEVKFNTTIILMEKFVQMYLDGEWVLKDFTSKFHTTLFFKQGGLGDIQYNDYGEWDTPEKFSAMHMKAKQDLNRRFGMEFLPKRATFLKFLRKFAIENPDEYTRLFNIEFRADELHRNFNEDTESHINTRFKGRASESDAYEDSILNKCGHIFSYAAYSDCMKCCICDRNNIWKAVHGDD